MSETAASAAVGTSISFNLNYITSVPGLLKIGELVLGLICWAIFASTGTLFLNHAPAYQFVMFVAVTSWLLTLALFIIYLFGMHASMCSGAPWNVIEFGFNAFWGLFYFIAACVAAAYAGSWDLLIAGTVFAWFTAIVYIVHIAISFKEWRGGFNFSSSTPSSGGGGPGDKA